LAFIAFLPLVAALAVLAAEVVFFEESGAAVAAPEARGTVTPRPVMSAARLTPAEIFRTRLMNLSERAPGPDPRRSP
jgi:hypothetical protein